MVVQVAITIQGHPWDLWGLFKLFDGSNSNHTLVTTEKPMGMPFIDAKDPVAVERFRAQGFDVLAHLTSDELNWDEETRGEIDFQELAPLARSLVQHVNGIAAVLDPDFKPVKLIHLLYTVDDICGGTFSQSDFTPNKSSTALGSQDEHRPFAQDTLVLAATNSAVSLVLAAANLARTWGAMYLIYRSDCR